MRAMVLAAGLGTRLRPLTHEIPKPVVPVLGVPLCAWGMEFLRGHGVDAFLLNLHHGPEAVREKVLSWAGGRFPVEFAYEPRILGTGGGIWNARDFLGDGTFLTANSDVIARFPLGEAVARHRESGALATLVLFPDPVRRYTPVRVREDGRIAGIGAGAPPGDYEGFFAGYQILEPEVLDHIPAGRPSCIIRETYVPLIARGAPVFGYPASGLFLDFGTPGDYLSGTLALLAERQETQPRVFVHPGASVGGGAILGPDAVIEEGARVSDGASVRRAIVWPCASVAPGRVVEDGILTPTRFVPARSG